MEHLHRLADCLHQQRDAILVLWRDQVRVLYSARQLDLPTLNDHMPVWIVEMVGLLRAPCDATGAGEDVSPLAHGVQRFTDGFDIEEVVAEYNILRDCVHDLAEREGVELRGASRQVVNKIFDDAIGAAVKSFAQSQALEVRRRRAEHLAFVAHDLRTPLSAITFSTHVLQQRLPPTGPDPETARLLKILARNTKQLETLVSNVLKENTQLLTELGVQVERRVFDLWPVVETLLQDLQPVAEKSGTRIVNQVPDDLEVCADAALLRRVFQNLIGNAIGYSPGGEVAVGARKAAAADGVECWVTDNGAGISPDRIDKVFEPLETDPERDGLGLGLAIVKTFVEAHDGTVSVESVLGEGATFKFTLPREARVKYEGEASQAVAVPPLVAQRKVGTP